MSWERRCARTRERKTNRRAEARGGGPDSSGRGAGTGESSKSNIRNLEGKYHCVESNDTHRLKGTLTPRHKQARPGHSTSMGVDAPDGTGSTYNGNVEF